MSCCFLLRPDFVDVVVFDFAQGEKLVSGGGDIVVGGRFGRGLARVADVIANFFGERVDVDVAFGRENHGALDDVLQFTDVARPGYCCRSSAAAGVNPVKFFLELAVEVLHEFEGEGKDVLAALAQRGDEERNDVEAVVKIFTEMPWTTASFKSALVAAMRRTSTLMGACRRGA